MKKFFLGVILYCACMSVVFAQKKAIQTEKTITYKTQDELVTREELSAIRKDALARGKNQQEVATIMDEEFKKLIAKKQADIINAQAEQVNPQIKNTDEKVVAIKKLSKEETKAHNDKISVIRAEYNRKRTEMLNDLSKQGASSQTITESEAKLKKLYPILFSEKN